MIWLNNIENIYIPRLKSQFQILLNQTHLNITDKNLSLDATNIINKRTFIFLIQLFISNQLCYLKIVHKFIMLVFIHLVLDLFVIDFID